MSTCTNYEAQEPTFSYQFIRATFYLIFFNLIHEDINGVDRSVSLKPIQQKLNIIIFNEGKIYYRTGLLDSLVSPACT